ncbi:hypothetical protein CSB37_03265 [bacterium DOLZORAL124_38_8]|nr:MAG: hypothetical protein CSB37_03265 [bacterium DOLZORAL124_38_8]
MGQTIFLLLILLVLSGVFSGMEIAFFSLGAEKIQAIKNKTSSKSKRKKIEALEKLKSDSNKLLVTILIGNNIVNVAASSMATVVGLDIAKSVGGGANESLVIGAVTGIMTFLILVFGEITPKSLAHKYALKFALLVTPILRFLQIVFYPVVYPISLLTAKFTGGEELKHGLTEEELKAAVELSEKEGQIDAEERDLVEKVLRFDEHTVENIMTPRSKIFSLPDNTPVLEGIEKIMESGHSRVPVFHENLEEIIGVLKINNLLDEVLKGDLETKNVANVSLIPAYKIPLTMKIHTLLKEFQSEQNHMAFVYDEYGGLIGLITLEDIIEEIFGEFEDEHDEVQSHFRQVGKSKFELSSEVELEQLANFVQEKLGDECPEMFPWKPEIENNTVSYFILELLEYFPEAGEKILAETDTHKFEFEILEKDDDRISMVTLNIVSK